ncbi:MAG: uroporphyrinogen-III C-methyltransferase [Bacillota bacterium]
MGKVYLIGAGPGDEELLTLKALKALGKCTAVLYDRLANPNILKFLSENCQIYYCGKAPGSHYKTQEEINDMLVTLATNGHVVGRIKGGDPYVFGRGGEEALRLVEEGIEFETIPGITSPIAVLNYAGIPITQRGMAQSFHVYTGKSSDKLNIDWEAAARNKGTLVFLMGLENLGNITENLITNGLDRSTPCAVIMKGTTAAQKTVVGNLENIYTKVQSAGITSPCITVVGKVVQLQESLDWMKYKPLAGMNICITRSSQQAKIMSEKLLDLGAEVLEINAIEIRSTESNLEGYLDTLKDYNYIILTSVNGVRIFFKYLKEQGIDIRNIKGSFAAIGTATENELRENGIVPDIVSNEFVAEELFNSLRTKVNQGDKILIPRSRLGRRYIIDALEGIGCQVDEVHIYDIVKGEMRNVEHFNSCNTVTFTSPSTVRNLIEMVGIKSIREKSCVAIGPITEKELIKNGIDCVVAEEYSVDGLINKLREVRNVQKT